MSKFKFIAFVLILEMIFQVSAFAEVIDLTTDLKYQPEGTTNLALSGSVLISSNYSAGTGSWHWRGLNDGKVGIGYPIGWTTNPNDNASEDDPAWAQIDLGDIYGISRIVLFPRQDAEYAAGFPVNFTLEVSIDGDNYTTVVTKTNETDESLTGRIYDITKINARYVRMSCTKRQDVGGQYLVQLAEMAIYGADPITDNGPTTDNEPSPETGDNSSFV